MFQDVLFYVIPFFAQKIEDRRSNFNVSYEQQRNPLYEIAKRKQGKATEQQGNAGCARCQLH
jgi:hypothetical protein